MKQKGFSLLEIMFAVMILSLSAMFILSKTGLNKDPVKKVQIINLNSGVDSLSEEPCHVQ